MSATPIADLRDVLARERACHVLAGNKPMPFLEWEWQTWNRVRILLCPGPAVWVRVPLFWKGLSTRQHRVRIEGGTVHLGPVQVYYRDFLAAVFDGVVTDLHEGDR